MQRESMINFFNCKNLRFSWGVFNQFVFFSLSLLFRLTTQHFVILIEMHSFLCVSWVISLHPTCIFYNEFKCCYYSNNSISNTIFCFLPLFSNQFSEKPLIYFSTWNLLTFLYPTWVFFSFGLWTNIIYSCCFLHIIHKLTLSVSINILFNSYRKIHNNWLRKTLILAVDFGMDFVKRFQRKKER